MTKKRDASIIVLIWSENRRIFSTAEIEGDVIIMTWIDKLERKYSRFGIPNLTLYIVICYVIGYFLQLISANLNVNLVSLLSLDPQLILRGQVWRLVSWVLSPPSSGNVFLFAVSILFFYYPIGTSLERTWGTFRYTLYIGMGMLFTILAAFLLYVITGGVIAVSGVRISLTMLIQMSGGIFTTYYISLSVFLAYAMTYPDMHILLWFVIPIKMRWMAIVYGVIIAYDMFRNIRSGLWFMVFPIVASLLNFVIFYFTGGRLHHLNPREVKRRNDFRKAVARSQVNPQGGITKHKCAICGRTEADHPELEFRFCSKCNGNYEYCNDHLFTHEHVK